MPRLFRPLLVLCILSAMVTSVDAGDWTHQGADAGMTKYSPDNIPVGDLQQVYRKRFYSKWTEWATPAYQFANNLMIRDGQAILLTNDSPDTANPYGPLYYTQFDWHTGTTTYKGQFPGSPDGTPRWFHGGENLAEIDSNHWNFPAVWHSDGRVYVRRGGDQSAQGALTVADHTWRYLSADAPLAKHQSYDTYAHINVYKNNIIYRPSYIGDAWNYAIGDISPAAWAAGNPGDNAYWAASGERVANQTDMPKVGADMLIVENVYNVNGLWKTEITATNLVTRQLAWRYAFPAESRYMGKRSDSYQYVATEDGYFAMFHRSETDSVLHVLNSADGTPRFTYPLASQAERPLLAYADGHLYVVGKTEQMRFDIDGNLIWRTTHTFMNDNNAGGIDSKYRPMVLTDDTLWFVDRAGGSLGERLIGIATATGDIFQTLDLSQLAPQSPTEYVAHVQDLVAADGLLGVLVNLYDTSDGRYNPWGVSDPYMRYQDLYVFQVVPEPSSALLMLFAGAGLLLRRRHSA